MHALINAADSPAVVAAKIIHEFDDEGRFADLGYTGFLFVLRGVTGVSRDRLESEILPNLISEIESYES